MKTYFSVVCISFLTASITAAEPPERQKEPVPVLTKDHDLTDGMDPEELKAWQVIPYAEANSNTPKSESEFSPVALEQLTRMLNRMVDISSIEDVPIEIFSLEPDLMKSLAVTGGYYLKSSALAAVKCYECISQYTFGLVFRTLASPVVSYTQQFSTGDLENFPPISFNYVADLLVDNPDRLTFAKFPLRKRAFKFQTEGFNGFTKGYDGYAIVQDFAYGFRRPTLGQGYEVVPVNGQKDPLDSLITVKEPISINDWIDRYFKRPNQMYLRKVGSVFKDVTGINTCLIYELVAHPDSLFLLVMRKPEKEYKEMTEIWKEAWRRSHSQGGTTPLAEGTSTASSTTALPTH